jgi:hypothetical protein
MAPIKDAIVGDGGSVIGALKPYVSIVVVINTSSISTTYILE